MAYIDLQELIQKGEPVYVRNKTGDFLNKAGPYILEIREAGKQAASVPIPATRFPFHLSAHVPAKLLGDSTEFYNALSRGILELVDPDVARREMSDPVAQKVVDQAMRKFQPTRRENRPPPELVTANNRRDKEAAPPGADKGISGLPDGSKTPMKVAAPGDTEIEDADVNPTVLQIVMDLNSDMSLQEEKYLELVGMEDLTATDLGHLLANCKKATKIVQWARAELAGLVGEDEAAEVEAAQEVEAELEDGPPPPRRRRQKNRRKK